MIEALGWFASIIVLISMTFKTMWRLRLLNAVACVLWIWYGFLISNNPTIFVNSAILVAHIFWFYKNNNNEN